MNYVNLYKSLALAFATTPFATAAAAAQLLVWPWPWISGVAVIGVEHNPTPCRRYMLLLNDFDQTIPSWPMQTPRRSSECKFRVDVLIDRADFG